MNFLMNCFVTGRGGGGGSRYFPSFIPPVSKSLWTCAVETVLEYTRVITDLFANERLLRFGLCQGQGNQGHVQWLNNWDATVDGVQQQCVNFVSKPWRFYFRCSIITNIHLWYLLKIAEKLGNSGPPPPLPLPHVKSGVNTVTAMQIGIKSAIEALAQPTPTQLAFMQGHGKSSLKVWHKKLAVVFSNMIMKMWAWFCYRL